MAQHEDALAIRRAPGGHAGAGGACMQGRTVLRRLAGGLAGSFHAALIVRAVSGLAALHAPVLHAIRCIERWTVRIHGALGPRTNTEVIRASLVALTIRAEGRAIVGIGLTVFLVEAAVRGGREASTALRSIDTLDPVTSLARDAQVWGIGNAFLIDTGEPYHAVIARAAALPHGAPLDVAGARAPREQAAMEEEPKKYDGKHRGLSAHELLR